MLPCNNPTALFTIRDSASTFSWDNPGLPPMLAGEAHALAPTTVLATAGTFHDSSGNQEHGLALVLRDHPDTRTVYVPKAVLERLATSWDDPPPLCPYTGDGPAIFWDVGLLGEQLGHSAYMGDTVHLGRAAGLYRFPHDGEPPIIMPESLLIAILAQLQGLVDGTMATPYDLA